MYIDAHLQSSPEKFLTGSFSAANGRVCLFPLFPLYTLKELDVFLEFTTLLLGNHSFPGTGCAMDSVLIC